MNALPPIFQPAAHWRAATAVVTAIAAIATMAGCTTPLQPQTPSASAASSTSATATVPAASRPSELGGSVAGQSRTFSTQLATYTSVGFDAVPGWARDDFAESWPAFLGSCKVLTGRGRSTRCHCCCRRRNGA